MKLEAPRARYVGCVAPRRRRPSSMTSHPDQIWSRGAFSRIARCPLEIRRLVAPPVGDHRVRIVAPLRARVARVTVPEPHVEVRVTPIPVVPSVANLVRAPNDESIVPRPTAARRAPRAGTTATPEMRSPTANDHRAATTETSATGPPNVALDQAAPVETIDRRVIRRRVTADRRAARALRARNATAVTERTLRHARPGPAVVPPAQPIAREHRDRTIVTRQTLAIADPTCRHATARRAPRARNVGPAS
jgi:hypothetical protein